MMTKEEFEKLKSTVKQWLFHIGSLDPVEYANVLRINFIEQREKRIEELEKEKCELLEQIEQMKCCANCEFEYPKTEGNSEICRRCRQRCSPFTEWKLDEGRKVNR